MEVTWSLVVVLGRLCKVEAGRGPDQAVDHCCQWRNLRPLLSLHPEVLLGYIFLTAVLFGLLFALRSSVLLLKGVPKRHRVDLLQLLGTQTTSFPRYMRRDQQVSLLLASGLGG